MKPLALVLAGLVVLTAACGGDKDPGPGSPTSLPATAGDEFDDPGLSPKAAPGGPDPVETGPAVKPPAASAVKVLVGRWKGTSPAKDYFEFNAQGAGKFVAGGKELWSGVVIPVKGTLFRLSWNGKDPGETYWQVEVKDRTNLVFAANQQTYEKVGAKPAATKPATVPTAPVTSPAAGTP